MERRGLAAAQRLSSAGQQLIQKVWALMDPQNPGEETPGCGSHSWTALLPVLQCPRGCG